MAPGHSRNAVSVTHEHDVRVIRLEHHAPAVGPAVVFVELGKFVVIPAFPLVRAGGDPERTRSVDRCGRAWADDHPVNIPMEWVGS